MRHSKYTFITPKYIFMYLSRRLIKLQNLLFSRLKISLADVFVHCYPW